MNFREKINSDFLILDGATGSNLQEAGMQSGDCPEQWILDHPDVFIELQKAYIEAGSDALYAPTFTSTTVKLDEYGLGDRQEEYIKRLVALSKEAVAQSKVDRPVYILGDISMTGLQVEPMGKMTFEELVDIYKAQVKYSLEAGVDGFAIETMMSLQESRAALLAVKESCDLPVIVTMTYQEDGRSLYGTSPETTMVVLQELGADAVGINCSTGPDQMVEAVKAMKKYARVPIVVKPNAGLPSLKDGKTIYDMKPEPFADCMIPLVEAGASVLGGCCGTTPEHIRLLAKNLEKKEFHPVEPVDRRCLTTERNVLDISLDGPFTIVGERINPTGKKALQQELRNDCLDMVLDMAEEQVEKGAKILDVNMGMNGIDEKEMMLKVVKELTMTVDVPLSIDSSYVEVVEEALRIYPGRALINSISLESEKFEKLIPVARKYGAMFVLLPLSDEGLPKDMEEKRKIIDIIVAEAKRQGLREQDIVVDGLVATIGANKKAALEVFETIRYCKDDLHVATICGLSNISFGLPERVFVNTAFLTMAIANGLTMAIANPSQTLLTNAALAADLLLNKEEADINYIGGVKPVVAAGTSQTAKGETAKGQDKEEDGHPLYMAVIKGKGNHIVELTKAELDGGMEPEEIINTHLIPAINRVGKLFEEKKYFLPQLISSAEVMEQAVAYMEPMLAAKRGDQKLDTIVMATVKGDIHDIGKNLVVLMLKNYGYDVIDLGKDVETEEIIRVAKEKDASIIGLSALMTTTMMEMKNVVDQVKAEGVRAKVLVGGAVVTQDFADEIGADGYSDDAQEAVKLVNRLLGKEG
ncbi:MAG: homocysteine S-methyltransferase family protein [Eubacterium sp.]|nr:homocysteine S-methyltransferase family protein [Eubacterium sp.]